MIPSYIKEASQYQYQMYEADYKSSLYLIQAFYEKNQIKLVALSKKVVDETLKSKKAEENYSTVWEREKVLSNWMYYFIKVPSSKCPAENYDIPQIPNPFAPPAPVGERETTG